MNLADVYSNLKFLQGCHVNPDWNLDWEEIWLFSRNLIALQCLEVS